MAGLFLASWSGTGSPRRLKPALLATVVRGRGCEVVVGVAAAAAAAVEVAS